MHFGAVSAPAGQLPQGPVRQNRLWRTAAAVQWFWWPFAARQQQQPARPLHKVEAGELPPLHNPWQKRRKSCAAGTLQLLQSAQRGSGGEGGALQQLHNSGVMPRPPQDSSLVAAWAR